MLRCVATPEIVCGVGGPGLTIVLGPCVGGMGTKHGGLAYAMNGHGQNCGYGRDAGNVALKVVKQESEVN